VGAGAGGVASVIAGSTIDTESDFTFAYEGIAGFAYAIAPRIDIGLTYKFLGATDHKFDSIKTGETYAHSILATFTFKF
jgi:opacity protein-like surface antigen